MTATAPGHGPLLKMSLSTERDIFTLRRGGRRAGEAVGLDRQDQVRLATALSELGRDRLGCAHLTVVFDLRAEAQHTLHIAFAWEGSAEPGPESLQMASRLIQRVTYEAGPARSHIVVEQPMPADGTTFETRRGQLYEALRRETRTTLGEDLRAQTHDLIATLEETRAQREELRRLNEELEETNKGVLALYTELSKELEDTNSGVVALHTELDDKSRQLRETSEAKTRFWTNVSHELRTPVNAVVAVSRLLLAPGSPPLHAEQREQISLVASAGHTLHVLVGDLLDVAKAESGQLAVVPAPVDLRTLVGQLRAVLLTTFTNDEVTLATPEPASLPTVIADEALLIRILRNLLSNALKFTEHGQVRLDFTQEPGQSHSWLRFTVSDTGIGIPPAEQQKIFEEFYQVRGPHQRGRQGTGLGLPYARSLARLLGGTLDLTSTPGLGTRVVVRVPDLSTTPEESA